LSGAIPPAALFVDTNVLVYPHDTSSPAKRTRAIEVLESVRRAGRGVLSVQVLGEFYNSLTRRIKPPLTPRDAREAVLEYSAGWPVVPVTVAEIHQAVASAARHQFHFWDALIWAAAKTAGASAVLTEDFQDGRTIEGVLFLDPFRADFDLARLLR
jgi:predicted nucleic acid-binding protein